MHSLYALKILIFMKTSFFPINLQWYFGMVWNLTSKSLPLELSVFSLFVWVLHMRSHMSVLFFFSSVFSSLLKWYCYTVRKQYLQLFYQKCYLEIIHVLQTKRSVCVAHMHTHACIPTILCFSFWLYCTHIQSPHFISSALCNELLSAFASCLDGLC